MSRPAVNTARDARIVTAARAGASVPDLARRFRLSAERIRQVLAAAGVPRRHNRPGAGRPKRVVYAPDGGYLAESIGEAARRCEVTAAAIHYASVDAPDGGLRLRYWPQPRRQKEAPDGR